MKKYFTILICFFVLNANAQETKKVLFCGDWHTDFNQLAFKVGALAEANGDEMTVDIFLSLNLDFEALLNSDYAMFRFQSQDWDYIILQESVTKTSFNPDVGSKPFAQMLNDSIKSFNPCTKVMFFSTWAYKDGISDSCINYPQVCNYDTMQNYINSVYYDMSIQNNAEYAPVGVAWQLVRANYPFFNMYHPFNNYANENGTYLAACVIYSSMFQNTTVGNTFISYLSSDTALMLQQIASNLVLDSLSYWNINTVQTGFEYSDSSIYVCDSINIAGNWYASDTLINDTIEGTGLCQKIIEYQVNIGIQVIDTFVEFCDSVEIFGNWYYSSGVFIDTLNGSSCLSIYNLNLKHVEEIVIVEVEQKFPSKTSVVGRVMISILAEEVDTVFIYLHDTLVNYLIANEYEPNYFFYTYECENEFEYNLEFLLVLKNKCYSDTVTFQGICDDSGSIEDLNNSNWKISPNPTNNFIDIESSNNENFTSSLYDISGREIILKTKETRLDLSIFDKGIYFIVLYNKDGMAIGQKKIVKN